MAIIDKTNGSGNEYKYKGDNLNTAYENGQYTYDVTDVFTQLMEDVQKTTANNDILKPLFDLIDNGTNGLTNYEKVSLKKDAYMELIRSMISQNQKFASEIVNKEYFMLNEIEKYQEDVNKAKAETDLIKTREATMAAQVDDNRLIKIIDSLSNLYGTLGAGDHVVSADMYRVLFNAIEELSKFSGVSLSQPAKFD